MFASTVPKIKNSTVQTISISDLNFFLFWYAVCYLENRGKQNPINKLKIRVCNVRHKIVCHAAQTFHGKISRPKAPFVTILALLATWFSPLAYGPNIVENGALGLEIFSHKSCAAWRTIVCNAYYVDLRKVKKPVESGMKYWKEGTTKRNLCFLCVAIAEGDSQSFPATRVNSIRQACAHSWVLRLSFCLMSVNIPDFSPRCHGRALTGVTMCVYVNVELRGGWLKYAEFQKFRTF